MSIPTPGPPPPGFSEAFQRALSHRGQGKVEEAILGFREAVRLSPRSAAAHGNLAILLALTGRAEEAVTEFQAALEADENDDGARLQLAMLLTKLGRPAQAAEAYKGFLAHAERAPAEYRDYARRQVELLGPAGAAAARDGEGRGGGLWFSLAGRVAAPTLGAGTALGTAADVAGFRGLALRALSSNPILAGGACVLAAASALVGISWVVATRGTGSERQSPAPAFLQRGSGDRPEDEAPGQAEDAPVRSSLMSFADKGLSAPPKPPAVPDSPAPAPHPGPSRPGAAPAAAAAPPGRAAAEKLLLPPDPGASGGFSGQFKPLQRRGGPDGGTKASGGREAGPRPGQAHAIHAEGAIGQLKFAERQALTGASARTDSAAAAMGDSSFAQQTPRGAEADEELGACAKDAKTGSGVEACRRDVMRRREKLKSPSP